MFPKTPVASFFSTFLITAFTFSHGLYAEESMVKNPEPLPEIRRVITGTNQNNQGAILFDGPPSNAITLNGSTITRIWETGPIPTSYTITEDAGAKAQNAYRPGFSGTSLYYADLPPGTSINDIPMHRQDSLDYITIVSGEIVLLLEDGSEAILKEGDVLVQGGNMHSWENRSDEHCRMLVVVMTATE